MAQLITKQQTADLIGWHPEHVMRESRAGRFPPVIRLGPTSRHSVRFDAYEVECWIESKRAERNQLMKPRSK